MTFLPEFALRARVVVGSDKDSIVLFGDAPQADMTLTDPKNVNQDLCLLWTGTGEIVVGVLGVDYYEGARPQTGFWQRVAQGLGVDSESAKGGEGTT